MITLTVNFTSQAMRKLCNLTNALVQHLEQLHFHLRVATLVTRRLVFVDAQSVALLIWRSCTWARPAPAKCLALLCYGRYRWWRVTASPRLTKWNKLMITLEHWNICKRVLWQQSKPNHVGPSFQIGPVVLRGDIGPLGIPGEFIMVYDGLWWFMHMLSYFYLSFIYW